ncbi:LOW QUALITY PROTEIN: hypothetical protein MAR_010862, partial [Mya arenaria]
MQFYLTLPKPSIKYHINDYYRSLTTIVPVVPTHNLINSFLPYPACRPWHQLHQVFPSYFSSHTSMISLPDRSQLLDCLLMTICSTRLLGIKKTLINYKNILTTSRPWSVTGRCRSIRKSVKSSKSALNAIL